MAVHTSVSHPTELAGFHTEHVLMFMVYFIVFKLNLWYVYIRLLIKRKICAMGLKMEEHLFTFRYYKPNYICSIIWKIQSQSGKLHKV
jgi:hypothetical protein